MKPALQSRPAQPPAAVPGPAPANTALFTNRQLYFLFWLGAAYFVGIGIYRSQFYQFPSVAGYLLVLAAALVPVWLWIGRKAYGVPIYPLFCGFQFLNFGMPLLSKHPWVIVYPPAEHFTAAAFVAASIIAGVFPWLALTSAPTPKPAQCLRLDTTGGERIFLLCVLASTFFNGNIIFNWVSIPNQYYSIFQAVCNGLNSLAVFVLGHRLGNGSLKRTIGWAYLSLTLVNCVFMNASLYLVTSLSVLLLAFAGFIIGGRRIPWTALAIVLVSFAVLHNGKHDMRNLYWDERKNVPLHSFSDMAKFYQEWWGHGLRVFRDDIPNVDETESSSLLERSSLVHLLLYARERIAQGTPLMHGETYTLIPSLLIPRVFYPDKPWALEGTTRLNVQFGLQSREETLTTTIGWGLFNEGYANFGFAGCLLVGVFLGAFYGAVARYAMGFSLLTFRALLAIVILSVAFQVEHTAGVWITMTGQTLAALGAFSLLFMRKLPFIEAEQIIRFLPRHQRRSSLRSASPSEIGTPPAEQKTENAKR